MVITQARDDDGGLKVRASKKKNGLSQQVIGNIPFLCYTHMQSPQGGSNSLVSYEIFV